MAGTITHADVDAAARWLGDVEFGHRFGWIANVTDDPVKSAWFRRSLFSEARHRLREQAEAANRTLPDGGRRIAHSVPAAWGPSFATIGGDGDVATAIVEPGRVVGFLPAGPRPAYEWRGED